MSNALPSNNNLIFSFFAGVGFLDLGFETSGFDIAFVNELNSSFLGAYKTARVKMKLPTPKYGYHEGDMKELTKGLWKKKLSGFVKNAREKGSLVGFIGGPPCPDFSVAGKNKGRYGKHGKLSAIYTTLISQQKPDFFLFENVKGMWRTKSHRLFYEELKKKLQKDGYAITERLINAIEYGVPQDRDRIILIGFNNKVIPKKILDPKDEHLLKPKVFPWNDFVKYPQEALFSKYKKVEYLYNGTMKKRPKDIPEDTTVEYWFNKNRVLTHPNSKHYFKPRQALLRFMETKEGDVSKKSFKRLHRWKYSPTVAYGNNEVHLHPYEARRLSVAEALSLQSLPRQFVLPDTMTLSEMFKAIGNGVPYKAAVGVAKSVNKFINLRLKE